ncbi:MAG: hypothetical protein KF780_11175 [Sphingomonas sp.]|nr:hypothetical protein [Sphingomonas sp.]
MYSESDLDAAVSGGALTAEQAAQFRDFIAAERRMPAVDEEHFRLLTGFNDIFVGIAAAILLVAIGWIGQTIPPRLDGDGPSLFAGLFVAATAWGLAEFFTRKRRMALPSILLLLAFTGGVFFTVLVGAVTMIGDDRFDNNGQAVALVMAFAAAIACGATWAHWRRFHVPVTVAAGAAAGVAVILGLIASVLVGSGGGGDLSFAQQERIETVMLSVALLLGVGTFVLAMRWDGSDPRRETRRSDVAFWLHLLAAPLIVHPIFSLLGLNEGHVSTMGAATAILLYVLLGLVALAVDRRALLVSALAYVLYALNSLFETYGAVELSVALTALVIGSALLLLSAFWTSARRAVVTPLPDGLKLRLPVVDRTAAA